MIYLFILSIKIILKLCNINMFFLYQWNRWSYKILGIKLDVQIKVNVITLYL